MWQRLKNDFREQVWDNENVLKLRQKFAELDTQVQSYILIGSFSAFVLFLLVTFFSLWGRSVSMKNDIAAIEADTLYAQKAAVRIEELKAQVSTQRSDPLVEGLDLTTPASVFLEHAAQKSLIAKANVEVSGEVGSGTAKLSRISLTQLVRMLYLMEKSGAGATVEKMNVDAKDNKEGYLWATFTIKKAGG